MCDLLFSCSLQCCVNKAFTFWFGKLPCDLFVDNSIEILCAYFIQLVKFFTINMTNHLTITRLSNFIHSCTFLFNKTKISILFCLKLFFGEYNIVNIKPFVLNFQTYWPWTTHIDFYLSIFYNPIVLKIDYKLSKWTISLYMYSYEFSTGTNLLL